MIFRAYHFFYFFSAKKKHQRKKNDPLWKNTKIKRALNKANTSKKNQRNKFYSVSYFNIILLLYKFYKYISLI